MPNKNADKNADKMPDKNPDSESDPTSWIFLKITIINEFKSDQR